MRDQEKERNVGEARRKETGESAASSGGYVYEGGSRDGRRHGRGRLATRDGDAYEGHWKDGRRHGRGRYELADGSVYEGDWRDGRMHGSGSLVMGGDVYVGGWRDSKRHGRGHLVFHDGDVYEGDWKDDYMHGKGRYEFANGDVYEGDWRYDCMHGKGRYECANGDAYEGDWRYDKWLEKGKLPSADSDAHGEDWDDGHARGSGKRAFPPGRIEFIEIPTAAVSQAEDHSSWIGDVYEDHDERGACGKDSHDQQRCQANSDAHEEEWEDGHSRGSGERAFSPRGVEFVEIPAAAVSRAEDCPSWIGDVYEDRHDERDACGEDSHDRQHCQAVSQAEDHSSWIGDVYEDRHDEREACGEDSHDRQHCRPKQEVGSTNGKGKHARYVREAATIRAAAAICKASATAA